MPQLKNAFSATQPLVFGAPTNKIEQISIICRNNANFNQKFIFFRKALVVLRAVVGTTVYSVKVIRDWPQIPN